MQSQVIICDQQNVYAMGCGLLIKDNPMLMGYHIINSLKELNELMEKEECQRAMPLLLVVDSALFYYGQIDGMAKISALRKKFLSWSSTMIKMTLICISLLTMG